MPRDVEHCKSPMAVQPVKVDNLSPGTSALDTMNAKILLMQAAATRDGCYDAQSYDKPPASEGNVYRERFAPTLPRGVESFIATYTTMQPQRPANQTIIFLIAVAAGLAGISIYRAVR